MTQQELDIILLQMGLPVPEGEKKDILEATHFIAEMAALVRKACPIDTESAHTVFFPEVK